MFTLLHPIIHLSPGYGSCFSPKMRNASCSWVGSHSHHKLTVPEFVWNRTETTSSSGSRTGCFGPHQGSITAFIPARTNHTKEPHKDGKWTRVCFNRTKQGCESTLKLKDSLLALMCFRFTPGHSTGASPVEHLTQDAANHTAYPLQHPAIQVA